jgi:uncharacterized protein (PEP-CTERM system associated)
LKSNVDWVALGGALLAAGGVMTVSAHAGDFRLTPSITVEQAVTDNARQQPPGQRQADTFTRLSPGVSMIGIGNRLNFNLGYSLRQTLYMDNDDLDSSSHLLNFAGTAELIDDMVFFDGRASITEATIVNTGAESADITLTNPNNRASVQSASFSPYMRNRLGRYASTEFRYTFNVTESEALSAGRSHRLFATMRSGEEFSRLRWALTGDLSHTDRSRNPGVGGSLLAPGQDSSADTKLFLADSEYRLTYDWALTGGIGYEETRDPTLPETIEGVVGSAGFRYNPSPRTDLALSYNRRNQSNFARFNLAHRFTERSTVTIGYDETLQTSEAQRGRNLDFLTVDQFGNFVDSRTASAFQLNNNNFNLNDNAVRRKTGFVKYDIFNERNSYSADFRHETSTTELTGAEQVAISIAGNWSRTISEVDRFNLTLRFRTTDFGSTATAPGPGRSDDTENVSLSFTHNFTPELSGIVTYSLLARQSSAAGADIVENLLTIGLRKTF